MDDERLLRGLRFTVQRSSLRTHRVAQTPDLGLRFVIHEPRTEKRGPRYPDNNDFRGSAATRNLLFGEQGADSSLRSD